MKVFSRKRSLMIGHDSTNNWQVFSCFGSINSCLTFYPICGMLIWAFHSWSVARTANLSLNSFWIFQFRISLNISVDAMSHLMQSMTVCKQLNNHLDQRMAIYALTPLTNANQTNSINRISKYFQCFFLLSLSTFNSQMRIWSANFRTWLQLKNEENIWTIHITTSRWKEILHHFT